MSDLKERVVQFNTLSLPGQPMAMHMGTSSLVNDLWKEIESLQRENEELSKDLRVMEANYDCTVDLLEQTRAEREVLKAAAITPEMRERMLRLISKSADETGWTTALCEVCDLLGERV